MTWKSGPSAAIELYNTPVLARKMRHQPFPDDVLIIIKAAAGSSEGIEAFPQHIAREPDKVREISSFYIQQLLFASNRGNYGILGLPHLATPEKVREHKRWLLKWLHPDRNNNRWEQQYFLRVTKAAESLEAQNEYSAIPKILPANSRPMTQIVKLNQRSNTRSPRKRVVSKIGGKLSLPYYKIGFVMLICVAAIFLFHSLFEDNLGLFENLLHVNSADTLEGK